MNKFLTMTILSLLSSTSFANDITFTTVNKSSFQSHWQLTDKEMARYEEFMKNEGQFRYQNLTPLEVLAISAPDEETMRYYAKKAAADEFAAVEAQLKFAVMVTEEKTKLYKAKEEENNEKAFIERVRLADEQQLQQFIDEHTQNDSKPQSE